MKRSAMARGARASKRHPDTARYCGRCGFLFNELKDAQEHRKAVHGEIVPLTPSVDFGPDTEPDLWADEEPF